MTSRLGPLFALLVTLLGASGLASPALAQGASETAPGQLKKARPPVSQPTLKQQGSVQARSAQGDCVREANRRGFAVIDTRHFQQFRDGWSIDLRVRDMRGRLTEGSCFVDTQSGDVNLYGFGWGYGDEGDDRLEFSCASVDNRYRECQLPIDGRVRLVRRISESSCVEGQSWGRRGDRVWVDRGCRARFEVTRGGSGGGAGTGVVDCASDNGRYRECALGPGYFARMQQEYSRNRCRQDVTWGTRNGVVWVTDGCRARFYRQRGNAGGDGSQGSEAAARRACLREAQQRGFQVVRQGDVAAPPGRYVMSMRVVSQGGETRNVSCLYYVDSGKAKLERQ
jgi:hypothetical protein